MSHKTWIGWRISTRNNVKRLPFCATLDLSESVAGSMVDLDSLVEDNTYEDTSLGIQTMKVLKAIYNCHS